ncbi:AAA family ATPase [Dietzia aerolata]|uniref:AAA family ATPase n=1 Tax=Dietzia aerolata TaxID=595984 RepID=UPI00363AD3EA
MLLVDEAGMASTENLAALTEIAAESGAVLRLVGDPKQLSAVETGGLLADLTRTPGTPNCARSCAWAQTPTKPKPPSAFVTATPTPWPSTPTGDGSPAGTGSRCSPTPHTPSWQTLLLAGAVW